MKKCYVRTKKEVLLLLFLAVHLITFAQTINVTGTVTDQKGEPLPGVNIIIVGTTQGTISDVEGDYSLKVPKGSQIAFNFIGFTSQTVTITDQSVVNISLVEDMANLDEVVVVGYGQMKRTDLTGSVVSVSSDAIQESVTTSVDQVLQGRAAGVQVTQNSGEPGGQSSIRIRGISSLSGSNEPIIVIDGVIIDGNTGSSGSNALSSINPSDIESMDILKDASATAIYGSRAANGVIIISTKKGKKGQARITYDGYLGWQEMPNKVDVLDLQQYAIHKNTRAEMGLVNTDDNFVRPDLLGPGTDWQDEMFSKAMMQSHNLSISGGSDKTTYAVGLGYLDQEGIAVGSGFERFNLRTNIDSKVKDFLKFGVNVTFSNTKKNNTISDDNLIITALKQTPNVAVRSADGSFDGPDTDEFVQTNPVGLAMLNENRNDNISIRANTYAEASLNQNLKFKTEYAFDYGMGNTYRFNPSYTFGALENLTRTGSRTKSFSRYWTWRNVLTYNKEFGIHNINVMAGQEMQKSYWDNLSGTRTGYLTNSATDLNLGDSQTATNSNSSSSSAISSFFGRLFYSINDKYLITSTLRYDGSSRFHSDYHWGLFPSAAFAWKISNENFLKDHDIINNLKLRLGWGAVGNENVGINYGYTATYAATQTANWGTGMIASNTANPELQWESTFSYNAGLDINLFKNRIELIADLYYKKTEDLLLQVTLPSYVGTSGNGATSAPWANVGSIENKGIELTLNTVNIDRGDFMWRSSFVFSKNKNKVLELNSETGIIDKTLSQGSETTIVTRTAVDQPVGQFYGYKVIGRFEDATDFYYKNEAGEIVPTALPDGMEIGENSVWIGDYIFEDINKDGVIDEEDRTYIGNPEPDFTFGIGNTFSYKGIDLNIFLSGSYGNEVINYQRRFLDNPRNNHNLFTRALDYAKLDLIDPNGPNDYRNVHIVGGDKYMPRLGASSASSTSNYRYSDRFIEDGSYLRIQNISLGYNLPKNWVRKVHMENVKVYANLQNVYTFTKYSGFDPEIGSMNQDALITGIDNGRYPSPRIYTFGLNVTF